jgi:hypothetical protein
MSNEQETFEALREELASCRRELYLCATRYAEALEQIENLLALVSALALELRKLRGGDDD